MNMLLNISMNADTLPSRNNATLEKSSMQLLPEFPITTLEGLASFEADIKTDKEIRNQFVSIFLTVFVILR